MPSEIFDLSETSINLRWVLEEIFVGRMMASGPIDECTAARFNVVKIGGRTEHKWTPATGAVQYTADGPAVA